MAKFAKAMQSPMHMGSEWANGAVQKLGLEKWLNYIGLTVSEALRISYFFGAGFLVGFVFKKYFKFVLSCALVIAVLVIILESRNLITIDWNGIKAFVGLDPATSDINSLWSFISRWIYENLYPFIGASVGFIFGYKLG